METLENYVTVTRNIIEVLSDTEKRDFGSFILNEVSLMLSNNYTFETLANTHSDTLNVFELFNNSEKVAMANEFIQIIKHRFNEKISEDVFQTLFE